jgi:hypothetical protein
MINQSVINQFVIDSHMGSERNSADDRINMSCYSGRLRLEGMNPVSILDLPCLGG